MEPISGCVQGKLLESALMTRDNWMHSLSLSPRDQFVLQPDGYGRIVGRLKEMIIRGGENIFPKEIEDFLNTHDNIIEAHVSTSVGPTFSTYLIVSTVLFR